MNKCLFIAYISVCWRPNQQKKCFKHFVHGQFDFQQLKLSLFMDEEVFICLNSKSLKKMVENTHLKMIGVEEFNIAGGIYWLARVYNAPAL